MLRQIWNWLDRRLDLSYFTDLALKKEVPLHRFSWTYFLGGMALFLLFVQLVTGILLLLYYRPSAGEAFESVRFIMTQVTFGWLIRSLHSWSANLLIGVAFLHMFTTYFMKAYRDPRELTWVSGVILLFLLLGFGFSGYLLPWNQLAFFATRVGTEIAGSIPVVGSALVVFLRGGADVTGGTLTRFFGFHVAVLPALTTVLVMLHLSLIQKQGMSVPPSLERRQLRSLPFFPNVFLRDLVSWYCLLGLLVFLAVFFPWGLGEKAQPFGSTPSHIEPEWYFLFLFQTLKFVPAHVLGVEGERLAVTCISLGGVVWLMVPFIDKFFARRRLRWILSLSGGVLVLYIVVMTFVALWT
jgi:cytochrome b6